MGERVNEAEALAERSRADALDALLFDYEQAFRIEVTAEGEWRWRRLDGLGDWTTTSGPDELRSQIRDDYLLKPVPRPSPPAPGPGVAAP